MAGERVYRGPHGTVYISSGSGGGLPYRTYDQIRAHVESSPEHPGIAAGYARLAAHPLQDTEIVKASRRREEENRRRGGPTGYAW